MQALIPIVLNAEEQGNSPTPARLSENTSNTTSSMAEKTKAKAVDPANLSAQEAKAVAEATASADRSFTPSPALLNSKSPTALLDQVDGPSLVNYSDTESVYVGSSVPISAGGSLTVPIQVNTPGSIVEYAAENKYHDIGFGITAEREEGITVVQEMSRCDASEVPMLGKFLVGTVPCLLQFKFDNEYSWMREKVVTYKVTITPPSKETLISGRRRRAEACKRAVEEDLKSADDRLNKAQDQKASVQKELEELKRQLELKQKSLKVVETEEKWLKERVALRKDQHKLLQQRMDQGWDDEADVKTAKQAPKKK
ncbi:unnamed protein product [Cylindrotheca closterium]|uniref:GOLD domain-containing protein n=1 Tax=Cylindrotheca closterium TaxID=2856 RepID=A0AAD2FQ51_9STRA|nr:unnamed protein product [Cylindrotheca closterium]